MKYIKIALLAITIANCNTIYSSKNGMLLMKGGKTMDQIFIKTPPGKTIVVDVDLEKDCMDDVTKAVEDNYGLVRSSQRFTYNGRGVIGTEEQTLKYLKIQKEGTLYLLGTLKGGSGVKVSAPDFDKPKKVTFSKKKLPSWRTVRRGFNIDFKCTTQGCKAQNEYVYVNHGFKGKLNEYATGFNFGRFLSRSECPQCKTRLKKSNARACGFYKCVYKVDGELFETEESIEKILKDEGKNGQFTEFSGKDFIWWSRLNVIVTPL